MLDVTCAPLQRHGPLTIFPLIAAEAPRLPYLLLSDALIAGTVRITEVGAGTVPKLSALNSGDLGVLILDGEQLIGAKQNRTTNRSLILPPRSETSIPVSCMEHGRWHHRGDDFKPAKQNSPSTVRRRAREVEATFADRHEGAPVSALSEAQGAVWSTIAERSAELAAHSSTGALDEIYQAKDMDIERWVRDFPCEPAQIGLLAFLGDRPLGLDVIGSVDLYASVHGRLVRGYIMDALSARPVSREPGEVEAQLYLRRVNGARRVSSPTVGSGDYSILTGGVIGGELTSAKLMVHLSAFPAVEHTRGGDGSPDALPISPPSQRRRRLE